MDDRQGAGRHPRWSRVTSGQLGLFPWLEHTSEPRQGRVELVAEGGRLIPAVVLRVQAASFRARLSASTPAAVLMDVVTVFPFPTPFAYVMPVIVDDKEDPFWLHICLNLFPIETLHGIPVAAVEPSDPLASRKLVRAFCASPSECGLVVYDQHGELLLARLVQCTGLTVERAAELVEVMDFLDGFDISKSYEECNLPQTLFNEIFCDWVAVPGAGSFVLPRNRSALMAHEYIFPIRVVENRLLDRRAVPFASPTPEQYDLFVSHAHADSETALGIVGWLRAVWPQARIYITSPNDDEAFAADPAYFLRRLERSKCILYLATRNSLHRPMVDLEVGASLNRNIVTVLIGVGRDELAERLSNDPFFSIDTTKIVELLTSDSWRRLVKLLSATVGRPRRRRIPSPPALSGQESADRGDRSAATQRYVEDYSVITFSKHLAQSQTQAEEWLDGLLTAQFTKLGRAELLPSVLSFTPRHKLIMVLLWFDNRSEWRDILERLPALVDEELVNRIDLMLPRFRSDGDDHSANRLTRIRSAVNDVIAFWKTLRRPPSVSGH